MSNIKSTHKTIFNLLSNNSDSTVESLMEQILELCTGKTVSATSVTDTDGNLWVYCYYHKMWENTEVVAYGSKVNTKTGLNTMCKTGTNSWTKKQRELKKVKETALQLVMSGDLEATDLTDYIETNQLELEVIVPRLDNQGYPDLTEISVEPEDKAISK